MVDCRPRTLATRPLNAHVDFIPVRNLIDKKQAKTYTVCQPATGILIRYTSDRQQIDYSVYDLCPASTQKILFSICALGNGRRRSLRYL